MQREVPFEMRSNRGSRLLVLALGLPLVVLGGLAARLWGSPAAQVEHVRARDQFAVISAWMLGRRGPPPEATEALLEALTQGGPSLRAAAAKALGVTRKPDLLRPLGNAARDDPAPNVRCAALEALATLGDVRATHDVGPALDDADLDVQAAACLAVGRLGLAEHLPALLVRLRHPEKRLRWGALEGLDAFRPGQASFGFDAERWKKWADTGE